jgi:preprotein translocase subunit SecA
MAISNILNKFFGNKSQRDIKEIMPLLRKIQEAYPLIEKMSHDQLRAKTIEIKDKIQSTVKEKDAIIADYKVQIETGNLEVEKVEEIYREIDRIEKEIIAGIEDELLEVLPDAFSIVKETARRFKENEFIEVTAQDFDKNYAAQRTSVQIIDDKARWMNTWVAGGNPITWDMVHYDEQLIGGVVLHEGKISEWQPVRVKHW